MWLQPSLPPISNTHFCCVLKEGEGGRRGIFWTRHHTNKAKIEDLHAVAVFPNTGIGGMHSVKEGSKEEHRERVRERACLGREKIPCRGSQSLKSSAKEGAPVLTNTHTLKAILLHLVTFILFSPPHPYPSFHTYTPSTQTHTQNSAAANITTKTHKAAPCG